MRKTLTCLMGLMLAFFFMSCSSKTYENTAEKEKTKGVETAKEAQADAQKEAETAKMKTETAKDEMKTGKAKVEKDASMAEDSDLTVEEAVIATDVEKLTPMGTGTEFTKDVEKIYCFSKIVGAKDQTEIKHKWYFGDKKAAEISLNVGSSPWRTYSSKTIVPEFAGSWRVDITTKDDKVIKSLNFEVK